MFNFEKLITKGVKRLITLLLKEQIYRYALVYLNINLKQEKISTIIPLRNAKDFLHELDSDRSVRMAGIHML